MATADARFGAIMSIVYMDSLEGRHGDWSAVKISAKLYTSRTKF
jgi:hypothetical protein